MSAFTVRVLFVDFLVFCRKQFAVENSSLSYCGPKMTDWIANSDNKAFHDFVDSAHVAVMSVLLGTALVDNSSPQALRSISMDVE